MRRYVELIDIREGFQGYDGSNFEEARDKIVQALRESEWLKNHVPKPGEPSPKICVDEMEKAERIEDFDHYLFMLYQLADEANVRIRTGGL